MRSVGLFYILICGCVYLDLVSASLASFFEDLPRKISEAWNYTWNHIVAAIKKPLKVKRLGSPGKLKTTKMSTEITSTTQKMEDDESGEYGKLHIYVDPTGPYLRKEGQKYEYMLITTLKHSYTTEKLPISSGGAKRETVEGKASKTMVEPGFSKLVIPHLIPPQWSNLEDWRRLQKPMITSYEEEDEEGTTQDKLTREMEIYTGININTSPAKEDESDTFGVLVFA